MQRQAVHFTNGCQQGYQDALVLVAVQIYGSLIQIAGLQVRWGSW